MEEYNLNSIPTTEVADLTWTYGKNIYDVASRGMIMYIGGSKGTYKSTLARGILAAALSDDGYMNFKYKPNGKNIVLVDTEMPLQLFHRNMQDLLVMTGREQFPENFKAFRLSSTPDPVDKRKAVFDYIKQNKGEIDMIVLDLITDLVADEGNTYETSAIMQELVALSEDSNSLVLCISHTNDNGELLNVLGRRVSRKARVGYILHKLFGWVVMNPAKDTFIPLPVSEFRITNERQLVPGSYIPFGIINKTKLY